MITATTTALAWYLLIVSPDGEMMKKSFETEADCLAFRQIVLTVPIQGFTDKMISPCTKVTRPAPLNPDL